ncbi:hypothetical protein Pelo_15461 [Pelomyxa schiedti]|nr:hypothetical protein Pelo_15461 [Pelomyxa schiedti]
MVLIGRNAALTSALAHAAHCRHCASPKRVGDVGADATAQPARVPQSPPPGTAAEDTKGDAASDSSAAAKATSTATNETARQNATSTGNIIDNSGDVAVFNDYCEAEQVPHQVIVALSLCLRRCKVWKGPVWVHELTKGCTVSLLPVTQEIPDTRLLPPSKDKEKVLIRLKHLEYQKMVANVKHSSTHPHMKGQGLGEGSMNTSLAANIIVAMGTCFVIGYYLGNKMYGRNAGFALGLVGMIGAMVVEVLLLMIYAARADETTEQRRKRLRYDNS